jgi:hypothetical protein
MLTDYWAERVQGLQVLDGAVPPRFSVYGVVLGRDALSVYPIGAFELCGDAVIYPPQTLNPAEDNIFTATATGLARTWDKTGILTVRFAKQSDGGDFAISDISEEIGDEAKHLLTMRDLWDGTGASFLNDDAPKPEFLELLKIGVSLGEELYTAGRLREALLMLPDAAKASLTGWYEKVLRHEG